MSNWLEELARKQKVLEGPVMPGVLGDELWGALIAGLVDGTSRFNHVLGREALFVREPRQEKGAHRLHLAFTAASGRQASATIALDVNSGVLDISYGWQCGSGRGEETRRGTFTDAPNSTDRQLMLVLDGDTYKTPDAMVRAILEPFVKHFSEMEG